MPENDKFKDYTRYAEHCLNMGPRQPIRNYVAFNAKWPPNGLDSRMQFGLTNPSKCKRGRCGQP